MYLYKLLIVACMLPLRRCIQAEFARCRQRRHRKTLYTLIRFGVAVGSWEQEPYRPRQNVLPLGWEKSLCLVKHKKKAPPPNCMNKIMITLLCSQSKRSLYTLLVTGSSGDAKCHISGRLVSHHELSCVTPWCVMCHSSYAVLLSILCIAEEDTAL